MKNLLTLEAVMLVNGLAIQHSSEWEDYLEMNAQIHGLTKEEYAAYYLGTQWQMQCMESLKRLTEKKVTRKQLDTAINDVAKITNDLKKVVKDWAAARDAGKTEEQAKKLEELKKLNDEKTAAQKVVDGHIQQLDKNVELETSESVNENKKWQPGASGGANYLEIQLDKKGYDVQQTWYKRKEAYSGDYVLEIPAENEKEIIKILTKIDRKGSVIDESVNEAKLSKIYNAAKKGSYPISLVATENDKVIKQELVGTPEIVPAAFNQLQQEYPNAKISIESRTGKTLFVESEEMNYARQLNENKKWKTMKNLQTLENFNEAAPKMSDSQQTQNLRNLRDQVANAQKGGSEGRYGKDFEKAKTKALRAIEQMITYTKIGV